MNKDKVITWLFQYFFEKIISTKISWNWFHEKITKFDSNIVWMCVSIFSKFFLLILFSCFPFLEVSRKKYFQKFEEKLYLLDSVIISIYKFYIITCRRMTSWSIYNILIFKKCSLGLNNYQKFIWYKYHTYMISVIRDCNHWMYIQIPIFICVSMWQNNYLYELLTQI